MGSGYSPFLSPGSDIFEILEIPPVLSMKRDGEGRRPGGPGFFGVLQGLLAATKSVQLATMVPSESVQFSRW